MENQTNQPDSTAKAEVDNFFVGSVPYNYDTFMGPMLLEPYAQDIVERIKLNGQIHVLELAAGTGRVTKHILEVLPEAEIKATDISEDMMAIAHKKGIVAPRLTWSYANMEDIPFEDNSFDLLICQFGLMFSQDKLKSVKEMYRVLKQGGQLLFNTWGDITLNPVWQISFMFFKKTFGQMPMPNDLGPFGLPSIERVVELLKQANFKHISGSAVNKTTVIESASEAAKGFLMTQPALKQKPELFPELYETLQSELAEKLGDKPLISPLLALVFEATK